MISEISQFINEKFNILMVIANIIFVCFYFMQWRESKRPILYTNLLSHKIVVDSEQGIESKPCILEDCSQGAYLIVSNKSKHVAENITIDYTLKLQNEEIPKNRKLSHLNPKESTKVLVTFNELYDIPKDIFEKVKVGDIEYKLPKQTLKFELYVNITFGYWPLRYSIKDSYYIEWLGSNSLPTPRVDIRSWNRRDKLDIYKTFGKNNSSELFQVR